MQFSGKLNIITGETGAGKSIIMGALNLILGERADTSVLVNKEKKCVVEGVFNTTQKKNAIAFLKENELDDNEAELVVRREIGVNGKTRAFINDTPVTVSQLQHLSTLLVDLHQQFDTLELGESNFQRQVLDALAGQLDKVEEYRSLWQVWLRLSREADLLKQQKKQFEKEADYNRFQYKELEEAAFKENELEDTEAELKLLNNSEGIKAALDKVHYSLSESEAPITQQLKQLFNQLNSFTSMHPDLPVVLQRLQSAQIELQDVAGDIDKINTHINCDPQRIESLSERLSLGYKLQKKHGVNSTAELLVIQQSLEEKLQMVLNIDQAITAKEEELKQSKSELQQLATSITAGRKKQAKPLEDKVNKLLLQVGMPNAKLKVDIQLVELSANGADSVEFLFDANKSGRFLPVKKVASGGELSRLVLCIKSLVAQSVDLPTLIFDEIDTGISGEAARQVGLIMKELATKRQVICITHQPQIAGKADAHYFVYKEIAGNAVKTNIRQLSVEERITSIAKMLSGEKPTAAAMENAREMVMN